MKDKIENVYQQVIDEELICAHLGITENSDDYHTAKSKVNSVIDYHITIATDSKVNGGYFLINKEDFQDMMLLLFTCCNEKQNPKLQNLLIAGLDEWTMKYDKEMVE